MTWLLPLLAALALLLAACGRAPETSTDTAPTTETTATREFVFSKTQSRAVVQGLGLHAQDAADLGDRLRVVLSVTRVRSGAKAGQKRASAVLIWGQEGVTLTGRTTLTIGPASTLTATTAVTGDVALTVKAPDFQVKRTRLTAPVPDTEPQCARFAFTLAATGQSFSATTPVEVCEGSGADAALAAVTRWSAPLLYTYQSTGASRFTAVPLGAVTGPADVRAALGVGPDVPVTIQTLAEFFAPLRQDDQGNQTGYVALERQFLAYYTSAVVYRVQVTPGREVIWILGTDTWGSSGLAVQRFGAETAPAPSVAVTFGGYGGVLTQEIQVRNVPEDATVYGRYYADRFNNYCEEPSTTLRWFLPVTAESEPVGGLRTVTLANPPQEDDGLNRGFLYEIHIYYLGEDTVYAGFACYRPNPLTLDTAQVYTDFRTRYSAVESWVFLNDIPLSLIHI